MKTASRNIASWVALGMALSIGMASTAPASAQACLDRREIQEAVSSGQIMSLDAVLASAGVGADSEVLNVQVCDQGGALVYIIGVLGPTGQAQNLTLSAR